SVTPIASSEFTLKGDAIVPAIGQNVDLNRWRGAIAADGPVLKMDENWQTGMDGVFIGGDVAGMDRFVTKAVGMGKEAAVAILAYISSTKTLPKPIDTPEALYGVINTAYHPNAARIRPGITGVEVRLGNFNEVQHPLDENGAMAEASRCFSCGICTLCDNCYFYCPDMAITRTGQGYEVNTDYCKGCGLCVVECPTGAIAMTEDLVP
ncbi:MAG: 4Fe-4S binding protein, partial [Rhodobacteraceae bacterium]|nr:4Fe-4S binding protein [Paracoccaceae bacterium]